MWKRLLWGFLSLAFPWLVLLLHDNPGGALVALIMQATLFGWIPATIWAFHTANAAYKKQKKQ